MKHGATLEEEFVRRFHRKIFLDVEINPEKKTNPYAPDLRIGHNKEIADLKTQNSPFFTAGDRFSGYNPRYTVTFNVNDYERYLQFYPDIHILFWVDWQMLEWENRFGEMYKVDYLHGVWHCKLSSIKQFIQEGAPKHGYQRRKNDFRGNAKDSYLLDIRNMNCIATLS